MKSRDFAFWLQGFFELDDAESKELSAKQVAVIKQHLSLVFQHDPEIAAKAHPPIPTALTQGGGPYSHPADTSKLLIC